MQGRTLALAGCGCLALSGTVSADLVGGNIVNLGDLGAGADTWAVYLVFDDPLDQLLAIYGDADISALVFDSPTPLVQNNLFEGMQAFDDVPSAADLGGDSWVVLGNPKTHNTAFSPNFLGGDGMESVIKGSHFEQLDNGGYFDANSGSGSRELPDENMQILIAHFTLDSGGAHDGFSFSFQGTAAFNLSGGPLRSRAFSLASPSPGALALLAVAGLSRGRRRCARATVKR